MQRIHGVALLTFCLVILFNPNVKIIDIFPDFIAYFIMIRLLKDVSEKVPYFAELKSDLKKLCTLSLIRIPAQTVSSFIKGKNTLDGDINVLMTLIFAVAETVLLCMAITNLFNALFYLGERTNLSETIKPFAVSKDKRMAPEHLRIFCYAFAVAKCALTLIPETFLLSFDTLLASTDTHRNFRAAYPYSIIVAVVAVLVIGIILIRHSKKYAIAILKSGKLSEAVNSLVTPEIALQIEKNREFNKKSSALTIMTVASFLTFEVCFSDLNYVNLLPHFIFSTLFIFGFYKLTKNYKRFLTVKISAIIYTVTAFVAYVGSIVFFSEYSYGDLMKMELARSAYAVYITLSSIELASLVFFLLSFAFSMKKYIINNTAASPSDKNYSRADREFHNSMAKKGFIFSAIGIVLGALKFADTLLNYNVKHRYVNTGADFANKVFMSAVPWLGLVITVCAAAFAGFAVHYFGLIKDDLSSKYLTE